ncbi:MAG: ATP-dependent helicase, partial [Halobacteriales archaeon]|nr:ATP-dependent helicase [Halobacteriales archaeon]
MRIEGITPKALVPRRHTVPEPPSPWKPPEEVKELLLERLTPEHQQAAVVADARRLVIVAGAGSGKTEVVARRIAWQVAVRGVPRESVVAFTFTEKAAEEMKFRVRKQIARVSREESDPSLGGMYIGTIHGYCLKALKDVDPDRYHNYDILQEAARITLVQRRFHGLLALKAYRQAAGEGFYEAIDSFLDGYDLLNEYGELKVNLPDAEAPLEPGKEADWVKEATLATDVGTSPLAQAFAVSAARLYAYMRARRFLDFSTSQQELVSLLEDNPDILAGLREKVGLVVIDEVQDINPVQRRLIDLLTGPDCGLTAVGDHRQAIYAWRGGRVDLMADLQSEVRADPKGAVIELPDNFRSTPRIIDAANAWADTITTRPDLPSPDMSHGRKQRMDLHASHVSTRQFADRQDEADWIARTIRRLVPGDGTGAAQDTDDGHRGLQLADIAILLRSATSARQYMETLRRHGIDAVVRAGPDLFSQPEVLLITGVLGRLAGMQKFYGATWGASLPARINDVLGIPTDSTPEQLIRAAWTQCNTEGLTLPDGLPDHLVRVADLIAKRLDDEEPARPEDVTGIKSAPLKAWLQRRTNIRRVFPQTIYHYILEEAGVETWDGLPGRHQTAMFHLGQLSSIVKEFETPGWTTADDLKSQIVTLTIWGAKNAKSDEAPLLARPDAVSVTTIHAAKGLEFAAVFVADVNWQRFPTKKAREIPTRPYDGPILQRIQLSALADNANLDNERRLLYVALTRAERYLAVSRSGRNESQFFAEASDIVTRVGGRARTTEPAAIQGLTFHQSEENPDQRLATSFTDLRYYIECPHDFYLRKVLGFAPSIDQAFGYGRGVHNIMRAIHTNPKKWALLAKDPAKLHEKLEQVVNNSGLFYLRYTTGEPLENMR